MAKGDQRHGAYVQRVHQDTQRYIRNLLADNERLRNLYESLEASRDLLDDERRRLERRVADLGEELDRLRRDNRRLTDEFERIEQENARFSSQYVEVEQRNSDLANLYVATYRLHGTLDRREVLQAIQEIVINLVGSEEFAVFETDDQGQRLELVASFGVDEERYRSLPLDGNGIGEIAARGEVFVASRDGGENGSAGAEPLTAVIPLHLDGRVTGAIAIFSLLPQKGSLSGLDDELFDVLATQAAAAVYCTRLPTRHTHGS